MEKLQSYLSLSKECEETVQKMLSRKFNNEQCGYLAYKLNGVVESASSFVVLQAKHHGPSSEDVTRWVEIFKLLFTLAKQIESFVQGCCKDDWIQAAMTLSNVSDYVASLGFNLELCRIAFSEERAETRRLKLDELSNIDKTEVESVRKMASVDLDSIKDSLRGDDRELANYLLRRLSGEAPTGSVIHADESIIGNWFRRRKSPEQIGKGASATVYKEMWLGTPVAKKTFEGPENPDFLKEVAILSRLSHPNIMSMFCYEKHKRSCSIIMELMDIGDLHQLMRSICGDNHSPPFPILEAIDIMLQVGEGVNYLHNNGPIVHRDLKSKNILVKRVEAKSQIGYIHAKVADFGISKINKRSETSSDQTYNTGTCKWMPPEVIMPKGSVKGPLGGDNMPYYLPALDTYSFGMVCYEILTGNEPFEKETSDDPTYNIKEKVTKGERPNLPVDCPSILKALIEKCWHKNPKERPKFPFICSKLKYLKYLLMTGGFVDCVAALSTAERFRVAADEARKEEAAAKSHHEAALADAKEFGAEADEARKQEAIAQSLEQQALSAAKEFRAAADDARKQQADAKCREETSLVNAKTFRAAADEACKKEAAAKCREEAALTAAKELDAAAYEARMNEAIAKRRDEAALGERDELLPAIDEASMKEAAMQSCRVGAVEAKQAKYAFQHDELEAWVRQELEAWVRPSPARIQSRCI